ncbi:hypothetical protein KC19_7G095900 [Ceratodon purpureus]|uniref:Uncharacterized protein n=1 Tax=Ceratodon purpureus TaxID=3225 RepID=A0A8T0H973_CERPU|nr:hypothetical protein KC19_7G095900 [Ceratodon purpureus]
MLQCIVYTLLSLFDQHNKKDGQLGATGSKTAVQRLPQIESWPWQDSHVVGHASYNNSLETVTQYNIRHLGHRSRYLSSACLAAATDATCGAPTSATDLHSFPSPPWKYFPQQFSAKESFRTSHSLASCRKHVHKDQMFLEFTFCAS